MIGVYYYVQPILIDLLGAYEGLISGVRDIQKTSEAVGGAVNQNSISPDLIEKIKKMLP